MPSSSPVRRARRLLGRSASGLALMALVAAGCADASRIGPPISPSMQEDSANYDSRELRSIGYSRGWRAYPIVTSRQSVEHVEAYDDIVLLLEGGSTLSCIDAVDGENRWHIQLETPVTPFLGIERQNNLIYVNSSSELYIVDVLSGELRARQRLPLVVTTGPTLYGSQLMFGCADGQIFSYVPTESGGVKLWGNQLNHPVKMDAVMVDGIAAFVSTGGDVLFMDPARGGPVMRAGNGQRFQRALRWPRRHAGGGPGHAAGAQRGPVALGVHAREQPQPVARADAGADPRQAGDLRRPRVHRAPEYGFSAVNLGTGDIDWSLEDVGGELVAVRDGLLVVFDADGEVITQIDVPTGDVFGRVPVGGVSRVETADLVDSPIYLITDRGLIARFNPDA